ncbi:MAG TPA: hypothetical protein PLI43_19655 [Albidovulum sp.]|uniref:hypothetical protein n=1 Tax=Albidovulum sp. TaxID=1872424 RepID=UPI002C3457D9|nr:hypothetical protein [Albidovulum sp.]
MNANGSVSIPIASVLSRSHAELLKLATVDQHLDATKLAAILRIDSEKMATSAGVSADDLSRGERTGVPAIQDWLPDMALVSQEGWADLTLSSGRKRRLPSDGFGIAGSAQ